MDLDRVEFRPGSPVSRRAAAVRRHCPINNVITVATIGPVRLSNTSESTRYVIVRINPDKSRRVLAGGMSLELAERVLRAVIRLRRDSAYMIEPEHQVLYSTQQHGRIWS